MQFGKVRTPETDPVRLEAYRELLSAEGPYLHGDPDGQGERQVAAIQRLRAELDAICDAFRASLAASSADELAATAEPLWQVLDLAGQSRLHLELADGLEDCSKRLGDGYLLLLARLGRSQALRRLGRHSPALDCAQEALELALGGARRDLLANALRQVGNCASTLGQTGRCRELLEQALALSEEIDDSYGWAVALSGLGTLDFEQGHYDMAWERIGTAGSMFRRLGCLDHESRCIGNLALLQLRSGELLEARRLFERSLQLKHRVGDLRGQAVTLANLGCIEMDEKQYNAARRRFTDALDLAAQVGDKSLQADLLGNLGMLAREENDYVLAATHLTLALKFHRENANRRGEGVSLHFMAILMILQDEPRAAARYLLEALGVYAEFGAQREISLCAGLAGVLLVRQGDMARGTALLRAALHHEHENSFRFEDDVQEILHSSLEEVRRASAAPDWSAAAVERAVSSVARLDCHALADFTLNTLRERFGYT